MKKANNLIVSLILGIAVLGLPTAARAAGAAQIERNVRAAARQLYANDPEARALAREAEAILIFPDIVKAGLVFGGSYGEGALLRSSERLRSAPRPCARRHGVDIRRGVFHG